MKPLRHLCLVLPACVVLQARGVEEILPGAKRVLFLGDSITYSGQYVESIEAYFTTRFPGRQIEFLNLGLPSETVSGLSEEGHAGGQFPRPDLLERLARVLAKTRPDAVIACYGMNDGIYLPFAPERFAAFSNGLVRLRERVTAAGAKMVHVTPPVFDEAKGKGPGYGNTLDRYSEWLLGQRAAGWDVADVHEPMKRVLQGRRQADPTFFLAADGVHAGDFGHWIIAREILRHLGAKDLTDVGSAAEMVRMHPKGAPILQLVQQKQRLLKDAWLNDTGHKRPGMNKGLPLAEARTKAAELDRQIRVLAKPQAIRRADGRMCTARSWTSNRPGSWLKNPAHSLPIFLLTRCRDFRNVWKKHGPGSLCPSQRNGARLCRRPAAARGKFEGVGSLQCAAVGRGRHSRTPDAKAKHPDAGSEAYTSSKAFEASPNFGRRTSILSIIER